MMPVRVRPYVRRNPRRIPRHYENIVEVNRRMQHISPSRTMRRIDDHERTMADLGSPQDTRVLKSYIEAIVLHIAGAIEWRHSLYDEAMRDERMDMTDKHYLNDAVREMQENERELLGRRR